MPNPFFLSYPWLIFPIYTLQAFYVPRPENPSQIHSHFHMTDRSGGVFLAFFDFPPRYHARRTFLRPIRCNSRGSAQPPTDHPWIYIPPKTVPRSGATARVASSYHHRKSEFTMAIRFAQILRPVFQDMQEDYLEFGGRSFGARSAWSKPVNKWTLQDLV